MKRAWMALSLTCLSALSLSAGASDAAATDAISRIDTASVKLMVSLLCASFGVAYFVFGRRRRNPIATGAGIALCVVPPFTEGWPLALGLGLVFIAIPLLFRFD